MLISEIPFDKVREAAIKNCINLGISSGGKIEYPEVNKQLKLTMAFGWTRAPEGWQFWGDVDNGNWDKAREIDKELGLGLFDEETKKDKSELLVFISNPRQCGKSWAQEMFQSENEPQAVGIDWAKDPDNGTTYKGYESATAYHQAMIEKEKAARLKPLGSYWHTHDRER